MGKTVSFVSYTVGHRYVSSGCRYMFDFFGVCRFIQKVYTSTNHTSLFSECCLQLGNNGLEFVGTAIHYHEAWL